MLDVDVEAELDFDLISLITLLLLFTFIYSLFSTDSCVQYVVINFVISAVVVL